MYLFNIIFLFLFSLMPISTFGMHRHRQDNSGTSSVQQSRDTSPTLALRVEEKIAVIYHDWPGCKEVVTLYEPKPKPMDHGKMSLSFSPTSEKKLIEKNDEPAGSSSTPASKKLDQLSSAENSSTLSASTERFNDIKKELADLKALCSSIVNRLQAIPENPKQ